MVVRQVLDMFDELDKNGSGTLDIDDMREGSRVFSRMSSCCEPKSTSTSVSCPVVYQPPTRVHECVILAMKANASLATSPRGHRDSPRSKSLSGVPSLPFEALRQPLLDENKSDA